MAATITHLAIADKILCLLDENNRKQIKNEALFYCGALAPDAIMARENYERSMKQHTHFKTGFSENFLHREENYKNYRSRLEEFFQNYYKKENSLADLYRGYAVHLLADELFILSIRKKYMEKIQKLGYDLNHISAFLPFARDLDIIDWRLVREYPFCSDVLKKIKSERNYEIQDYITRDEIEKSKNWVIQYYFMHEGVLEETVFCTYEENIIFIDYAAKEIIRQMKEGIGATKFF